MCTKEKKVCFTFLVCHRPGNGVAARIYKLMNPMTMNQKQSPDNGWQNVKTLAWICHENYRILRILLERKTCSNSLLDWLGIFLLEYGEIKIHFQIYGQGKVVNLVTVNLHCNVLCMYSFLHSNRIRDAKMQLFNFHNSCANWIPLTCPTKTLRGILKFEPCPPTVKRKVNPHIITFSICLKHQC